MIRTTDGWMGLSLPRAEDLEMVPALVESVVDSPWVAVREWAARMTAHEAVDRCHLLGLAASVVPPRDERAPRRIAPPVVIHLGGERHSRRERPLVVDFSALWAGPLCAHLLGLTGAEVVKVESVRRPDGSRRGPKGFYDLLHHGHGSVAVDFSAARDVDALLSLLDSADLVIESSRARALAQHGIRADRVVEGGVHWLSITARGRSSDTIGFGDDVAAGAGLLVWDDDQPLPAGDAMADPLAGVAAAAAAAEALLSSRAQLIDVSMGAVAQQASLGAAEEHAVRRFGDQWFVECAAGDFPVAEPALRSAAGHAHGLGADTDRYLA